MYIYTLSKIQGHPSATVAEQAYNFFHHLHSRWYSLDNEKADTHALVSVCFDFTGTSCPYDYFFFLP